MSPNLFWQTLTERKVSLIVMILALPGYVWMIAAIANTFINAPEMKELIKVYPEELLSFFGGGEASNFLTPEGFLGLEMFELMWPIIVGGYAITMATALVGKEIDQGTIEALLTQPISRLRLLSTRIVALAVVVALLVLVTTVSTQIFSVIYDVELKTDGLIALAVLALAFFAFMSSYALLFSMFMERGRAILLSIAVFVISYIFNSLAAFSETVEGLKFLSFMDYYEPTKVMASGDIPWPEVMLYFGLAAAFIIVSYLVFRKKNIAI
jgi:ABC-2 type transport system permease protein